MDVHLYVTQVCNLKCKHCYYDASDPDVDRSDEITIPELRQLIGILCDKHDAGIEMEGGEVFMREDIPQLLGALSDRQLNAMTITSNGTIPLDSMIQPLRKLHAFRISIEGHTEEIHGRLRQSCLNEVVSRARALNEAGVPVVARCTLNRANWLATEDFIASCAEWGLNTVQLFEFQSVGRGRHCASDFTLGVEEVRSAIKVLANLAKQSGCPRIRLSLPSSRLPIVEELLGSQYSNVVAARPLALRNSLTIDRNGDLGVCPWLVGSDVLGNLRDLDLEVFLATAKSAGKLVHECAYCSAVHLHFGGGAAEGRSAVRNLKAP